MAGDVADLFFMLEDFGETHKIEGKPVVMVGHRKGNRDLLKFYWEDGAYHAEVIDHDCGPANAYGFHNVIATNREINEIAMYEF